MYEPSDTDFGTPNDLDDAGEGISSSSFDPSIEETQIAASRGVPDFENDYKRRRRKRKQPGAITGQLPGGELPPDGKTRFDWRNTALSRKYIEGSRRPYPINKLQWFDRLPDRVTPPESQTEVEKSEPIDLAIKRYQEHFLPLVQVERDEAQRQFEARLHEWSLERLKREGFMLDNLGGKGQTSTSLKWLKDNEVMVTFTPTSKDATKGLLSHKFARGIAVMVSRTDPLLDPILSDGTIGDLPPRDPTEDTESSDGNDDPPIDRLVGRVEAVGKGSVRVRFALGVAKSAKLKVSGEEAMVQLVTEFVAATGAGKWRLDVAFDEYPFMKQMESIEKLRFDPVSQDMAGFPDSDRPRGDVIDQAMEVLRKAQRPAEEQILQGTALRHLLLGGFQSDPDEETRPNRPQASALSPSSGSTASPSLETHPATPGSATTIEAPAHAMTPSDIDATVSPGHHISNTPRGVLARDQLIQSWTRRYRTPAGVEPVVVEGDPEVPLNPTQKRAMAMMLSERLSLVQGPPGTGKTRVIVEMIKLLKAHWKVPHPVLVCAHTNVAVDNLVDGLVSHNLKVLRLGSGVRDDLRIWTLDERMELHPTWKKKIEPLMERKNGYIKEKIEIEAQIEDVKKYGELAKGGKGAKGRGRGKSMEMLKGEVEGVRKLMKGINARIFHLTRLVQREVIADADVICATCLTAASRMFEQHIDFPFVFLDEASMATEPLSLVPLMRGSTQVAIIGDHKQLPPVILSDEARNGGLAVSMFERLIHEHSIPSIMLDTQYRMHPSISAFSSKTFYNSQLLDGTVLQPGNTVRPGLEPPHTAFLVKDEQGKSRNVTFIDHDRYETAKNRSVANVFEAELVWDVVHDLLYNNPDLCGKDIGVVAPYAAQIAEISNYLDQPNRYDRICASLGETRAEETSAVEVKTVDGFEGREKDVIIFSCTRANSAGFIGFLGDWRRLNVGITRAKKALIIIGSRNTLKRAKMSGRTAGSVPQGGSAVWRAFIKYLEENEMILSATDVVDVPEEEGEGVGWEASAEWTEEGRGWDEGEWEEEERAVEEVLG